MARPIIQGQMRLPKFHGDVINHPEESWQKYLNQIDLAYKGSGLTDATDDMKQAHLLSGLEGRAKQFYEANPHLTNSSYEEVKKELQKKFDKPNLQELIDIARIVQKPGESCQEFLTRLKEAAKAINAEDDYILVTKREALAAAEAAGNADTVRVRKEEVENHIKEQKRFVDKFVFHYFLRGLRPGLKQMVLAQQSRTLEQAFEFADKQEQYMEVYGGLLGEETATVNANTTRDETVERAAKQLQALNIRKDGSGQNSNKERTRGEDKGVKKRLSFSSAQKTVGTDTRNRSNSKTDSLKQSRCYFCARPGHLARDCRTRARYMQSSHGPRESNGQADRPKLSNMSPGQAGIHGMARYEQRGKSKFPYEPFQREARSTWVDIFLNKQKYYPQSKNELRHPPWGGSKTQYPLKDQYRK
jgi:hypothetical protein